MCAVACLGLGKNPVPRQTVTNFLQRIGSKPITYKNFFTPGKRALLLQSQFRYVEDILVTRDTANFGMSRREVIPTISDIGQSSSYVQEENFLDCLIRESGCQI